ncbi:mechanosensitive ion channel-like protein [Rhizobium azibense]|uniref:Small-conductance mechanosensitive channel n=1 Tax=Rhizobium azibense TaxID=1136135 RepID=A0A4R3RL68_9HYPH|nr:mechanosensitive ion channel-like protein [Rhizobium azibense]
MKTSDGLYRLAPNSILWNTPITNYSREPTRQNELKISLAYEDDADAAMERLLGFAKADPRILRTPAPAVFIDSMSGATIGITLRYWAKTGDWWGVSRDMIKRAKLAVDRNGHLIPPYGTQVPPSPADADAEGIAGEPAMSERQGRR